MNIILLHKKTPYKYRFFFFLFSWYDIIRL